MSPVKGGLLIALWRISTSKGDNSMINWVCDLPVKIYRLISLVFALSTVTLFISALPVLFLSLFWLN